MSTLHLNFDAEAQVVAVIKDRKQSFPEVLPLNQGARPPGNLEKAYSVHKEDMGGGNSLFWYSRGEGEARKWYGVNQRKVHVELDSDTLVGIGLYVEVDGGGTVDIRKSDSTNPPGNLYLEITLQPQPQPGESFAVVNCPNPIGPCCVFKP